MTELVDIELGHFYLGDLLDSSLEVSNSYMQRGLSRASAIKNNEVRVQYSLFIDDLGGGYTPEQKQTGVETIERILTSFDLLNVDISFESEFEIAAHILLETLRKNYILTVDGASYLTLTSQDPFLWAQETLEPPNSTKSAFVRKLLGEEPVKLRPTQSQFLVPLHTPEVLGRQFGCSLLTAVWYLARLGVVGFDQIIKGKAEKPTRLVNILPIKYLKSEGFALDLINISSATRIRKAAKRIEYILL